MSDMHDGDDIVDEHFPSQRPCKFCGVSIFFELNESTNKWEPMENHYDGTGDKRHVCSRAARKGGE